VVPRICRPQNIQTLRAPLLVDACARHLLEQRETLSVRGVGEVRDAALRHNVVRVTRGEARGLEQARDLLLRRGLAVDGILVAREAHGAPQYDLVAWQREARIAVIERDLDERRERRRCRA